MNEEKNNVNNVDEELCEAIANLYHCMQERNINGMSVDFPGYRFLLTIEEEGIRINEN